MMSNHQLYSRIISTGSYLPQRRISNDELAYILDSQYGIKTSDTWIFERTGIAARYFADPHITSSDLALKAASRAIQSASIDLKSIDLIIVATSTPDYIFPSTACLLQNKLGITNQCAAFDMQAVCSGFIYAIATADSFLKTGTYQRALIVGTETFSRLLNFNDHKTCVLFGDGAGALILEGSIEAGILSNVLHADGNHADILCVPGNVYQGIIQGKVFLHMDGKSVFKLAITVLERVAREALAKVEYDASALDWFIPHQANIRIMRSICKRLGLPIEKMVETVQEHGNTSAASIPLALDLAIRDGRIQHGQLVMLEGVGGGFTWGATLLRY